MVRKRKCKAVTTYSKHWLRKYPNLTRGLVPLAANRLWVSDITYISVADGFAYPSLVTNADSHEIAGFCLSRTLRVKGSVAALEMAIRSCTNTTNLLHHSDRGAILLCGLCGCFESRKHKISMTENGDPLENAIAERANGILKEELLQVRYDRFEDAKKSMAKAIAVYNTVRLHSSCDMPTPVRSP